MATVVSVYEVDPYPRTAEQILDPEQQPEGKRPQPQNKRSWARVEADQGTMIEQGFAEAVRRDPDQKMRWVVLTDGQEDLLRQVDAAVVCPSVVPQFYRKGCQTVLSRGGSERQSASRIDGRVG
jgi:hypothetical protein